MPDTDSIHRFLFEHSSIRGNLVHLDASLRAVLETHPYPPAVRVQLGQALAAVALLCATIKFNGSLILQVQGRGPLRTLVAQATSARTLRGIARWEGEVPMGASLAESCGEGRLVLTIERGGGEPYHEDDVRLFESEPLAFRCGCSRRRIEDMLRTLGEPEVRSMVTEQGAITVTCEFCNRTYRLDAVDAGQLFAQGPRQTPSAVHH